MIVKENISDTSIDVKKLTKDKSYEFRITAENKIGMGLPVITDAVLAKNPYGIIIRIISVAQTIVITCVLFFINMNSLYG